MAKNLDPEHDLRFKFDRQVGLTHKNREDYVPGTHAVTKKGLYQQKLDDLNDAVLRKASVEDIEEIQAQIRKFGKGEKIESAIEKIMWTARRTSQGMDSSIR